MERNEALRSLRRLLDAATKRVRAPITLPRLKVLERR